MLKINDCQRINVAQVQNKPDYSHLDHYSSTAVFIKEILSRLKVTFYSGAVIII